MQSGKLINRDKLLKAIKKYPGRVGLICKAAGISTSAYYKYRDHDREIAEAIAEANDEFYTSCEAEADQMLKESVNILKEKIETGDMYAAKIVFNRLAYRYGWSPVRESGKSNEVATQFQLIDPDA